MKDSEPDSDFDIRLQIRLQIRPRYKTLFCFFSEMVKKCGKLCSIGSGTGSKLRNPDADLDPLTLVFCNSKR
jgi:hypothetical protein